MRQIPKLIMFIVFYAILLHNMPVLGQTNIQRYIGLETGFNFMGSHLQSLNFVRNNISSYYYSSDNIYSTMNIGYMGIKEEFKFVENRLGVLTGLRFTRMFSRYEGNSNYFYMLLNEDGLNTEYIKGKQIVQTSQYIGIPLEFRYFTTTWQSFMSFYIKMGFDINLRLHTRTDIDFVDESMGIYENEILHKITSPNSFYSSFNLSFGYRFGKESRTSLNLEMLMPSVPIINNSSSLVKPFSGIGFQITVEVPLKNKKS